MQEVYSEKEAVDIYVRYSNLIMEYSNKIRDLEEKMKVASGFRRMLFKWGSESRYKVVPVRRELKEILDHYKGSVKWLKSWLITVHEFLPDYAKNFKKMWRRNFLQSLGWVGVREAVNKPPMPLYIEQTVPVKAPLPISREVSSSVRVWDGEGPQIGGLHRRFTVPLLGSPQVLLGNNPVSKHSGLVQLIPSRIIIR